MSFFTYYGKLKNELFVAVLPKGTVEIDDPIHIFSDKQFMTYRARDVAVTDDGEDRITFNDGYYTFEAVTSKSYRSINLTRKRTNSGFWGGEADTVALTRQYDQAQTATPMAPRIWTGAISFHQWANNESFVIVAPKGLGHEKPIVALWQWTKDAEGVPKTLSYGTSKQICDGAQHEKFSFKQNGYYTLDCQINTTTKGLQVTVKAPTNPDKVQKELVSASLAELGAEHRFTPPHARHEKVTLDCSLPNAKPSLPRITAALPFPADLVETLSYSAAYVDQAGYLAKYAVKQFEKLDKSYHLLEKKSEQRAEKIIALDSDVRRLTSENQTLSKRNAELVKHIEDDHKKAAQREDDLEDRLQKALASLQAAESKAKMLEKQVAMQKAYIDTDKVKDAKLEEEHRRIEEEHRKHEEADHKAIDLANKALKDARKRCNELVETVENKNKKISGLKSDLDAARNQLGHAKAENVRLSGEKKVLEKQKAEIQAQLEEIKHKLSVAEQDVKHLRASLEQAQADLKQQKIDSARELEEEKEHSAFELKNRDDTIEGKETDIAALNNDIAELKSKIASHEDEIKKIRANLKENQEAHQKTIEDRDDYQVKYNALSSANSAKEDKLKNEHKAALKKLQDKIDEYRKHDDAHHNKAAVTVGVTELTHAH
jgi:peptidoglycan hydrolase CwlO-like protein